jgi:hypothetical protein
MKLPVFTPIYRNIITFLKKHICICWRKRSNQDYNKSIKYAKFYEKKLYNRI